MNISRKAFLLTKILSETDAYRQLVSSIKNFEDNPNNDWFLESASGLSLERLRMLNLEIKSKNDSWQQQIDIIKADLKASGSRMTIMVKNKKEIEIANYEKKQKKLAGFAKSFNDLSTAKMEQEEINRLASMPISELEQQKFNIEKEISKLKSSIALLSRKNEYLPKHIKLEIGKLEIAITDLKKDQDKYKSAIVEKNVKEQAALLVQAQEMFSEESPQQVIEEPISEVSMEQPPQFEKQAGQEIREIEEAKIEANIETKPEPIPAPQLLPEPAEPVLSEAFIPGVRMSMMEKTKLTYENFNSIFYREINKLEAEVHLMGLPISIHALLSDILSKLKESNYQSSFYDQIIFPGWIEAIRRLHRLGRNYQLNRLSQPAELLAEYEAKFGDLIAMLARPIGNLQIGMFQDLYR